MPVFQFKILAPRQASKEAPRCMLDARLLLDLNQSIDESIELILDV
jgi:hypothetical protein